MVDLHSHILPETDDGPSTCEEAVILIRMEIESGVDTVALTPHFCFDSESIASFVCRRAAAYAKLDNALAVRGITIKMIQGAEVLFSPMILKYGDIDALCYAGTNYMLVEFPENYFPEWAPEILKEMNKIGVTPVIAHVERYPELLKNPGVLYDIIYGGALIQTNADAIAKGRYRTRSAIFKLIEHNLIHFIVTDTHNVYRRPPMLKSAMETIIDRYGRDRAKYFENNSRLMAANKRPDIFRPKRIK